MKVKMLGLYIRAMVALSLIFIGTGVSWAAKRYLVTIESPLTYQVFKQASQKKNGKSPALQMLAHSGARVEKMLDQVQMVVVNADSNKAVEDLKGQYGIADVEEEFFIPVPQSLPSIRSFALAAEKVSIPWGIEAVRAPEAWLGSHAGRDVRVLVLDTGIDKDHPDLASRFEKGKNFADVDLTDAPYDYFDNISHGTHVAGTIAADGKVSGLVGVAPEARILSARVCSSMGCSSISILDGINWGIQEKVDVMNLSLGGPIPSRAGEKAYKQAAAAGIVVVCASGNDGVNQVSYPGAYDSTIAVGAVDEDIVKADFSNWGSELDIMAPGVNVLSSVPQGTGKSTELKVDYGDGRGFVSVASMPVQGSALQPQPLETELVSVGLGKPEDYNGIDVSGKIALVLRGEITFLDKMKYAEAAGAAGIIFYNNEPGVISPSLGDGLENPLPAAFITQELGEELAAKALLPASLHSRSSDYEKMAGTSMATPHISGVVALIKGVNPNLSPSEIKDILIATAHPMSPNDANQTGKGMVDAYAAVNQAMGIDSLLPKVSGF